MTTLSKHGGEIPDDTRDWEVEPIGTLDGTNVYGAAVQIPAVRFWSYREVSTATEDKVQAPLTGEALESVTFVQSHVRPTAALLAEYPDIGHVKWDALNNAMVCKGCWFVSAHVRIHSGEKGSVEHFENPGWEVNLADHTIKPDPDAVKFFAYLPSGNR